MSNYKIKKKVKTFTVREKKSKHELDDEIRCQEVPTYPPF